MSRSSSGRGVVLLVDRDRQRLGHRLHDHLGRIELDLAGRQTGDSPSALSRATTLPVTVITLSVRTRLEPSVNTGLRAVDHDLGHAVVIAQVDEQQIAVVALALDPAGQAGLLADMLRPQLAAGMGSVNGDIADFPGLDGAAKGTDCPRQVKGLGPFRLRQLCRRPTCPL